MNPLPGNPINKGRLNSSGRGDCRLIPWPEGQSQAIIYSSKQPFFFSRMIHSSLNCLHSSASSPLKKVCKLVDLTWVFWGVFTFFLWCSCAGNKFIDLFIDSIMASPHTQPKPILMIPFDLTHVAFSIPLFLSVKFCSWTHVSEFWHANIFKFQEQSSQHGEKAADLPVTALDSDTILGHYAWEKHPLSSPASWRASRCHYLCSTCISSKKSWEIESLTCPRHVGTHF